MMIKINKMKGRKGFTLVELLLVVAILAVLAFLAVPAIAETIRNSRMRTCASNERMIEDAVWRYYADGIAAGKTIHATTGTTLQLTIGTGVEAGTLAAAFNGATTEWTALSPYFTPGGPPNCPFTGNAGVYTIDIEVSASGLDDVFVMCEDAAGGTGTADHPRATDRRLDITK